MVAGRAAHPAHGGDAPPAVPLSGNGSATVASAGGRRFPLRARLAVSATNLVNGVSKGLGLGSGTVAGGRVGLALDPGLLGALADRRPVALVTGTNGKTTTTAFLVAAARALGAPGAVTNQTGSNMPAGHAAALAAGAARGDVSGPVVLEVDEGYVPAVLLQARPRVLVMLNLSRDQLDRTNEVRMVATRWRRALADADETTVVANVDDPLVVWGAGQARRVRWVAAGARWLSDAVGCPACEGRIDYAGDASAGWSCHCGFRRPAPDVEVVERPDGSVAAVWPDGSALPVELAVPGRFNRANAVMAAVAADCLGVPVPRALSAMSDVQEVAGRFAVVEVGPARTRLLLAKNPAGWSELLDLVAGDRAPVVVAINARVADGRDPSWLWDVAFEQLRGRRVVASGERCHDLAVRLRYAEVDHLTERDSEAAIRLAAHSSAGRATTQGTGAGGDGADGVRPVDVEFIGNYTAFHDLWKP